MQTWIDLLKSGLNRKLPKDPVSGVHPETHKAHLSLLRPYLGRHWQKAVVGAVAILVAALLAFPQPLIMRFLVDQVILGKRLDLLLLAAVLLGGVKLLEMGSSTLEQYYFTRFEQDVSVELQRSLLEHALRLPKAFFDDKEVGYLMSRLVSDLGGLRWFFSSTVVYIASSVLRFVGGVAFLFYLEWRLAIVTVVVLPILVLVARYFSGRMLALSHHGMEQSANVFQRFEETLASVPLIKAFVSEKHESERIMDEVRSERQIMLEQTVVGSLANTVLNVVPYLSKGVVLLAGAYWVIRGEWTLGSLLAFQAYLDYVYGPAMFLANANLELQNALASLERVSAMFEIVPEENAAGGQPVKHLEGEVQFDSVSFSYGGKDSVLEDVSFHASPGEHIMIAGPSGVGKTTLVSLLLRFYQPTRGEIQFDRRPASDYELGSLRERIGYVSQSPLLMAGTIRENLLYGNPEASQSEIERAVQIAEIQDFIQGLPDGYESAIGERGVNLSEGQKQRLCIARALIKDPDILVMDEPTSALDGIIEQSILEMLPGALKGKTIFVITHRLSTISKGDRILLLNQGGMEAIGTHQDLLARSDYYRSLFKGV